MTKNVTNVAFNKKQEVHQVLERAKEIPLESVIVVGTTDQGAMWIKASGMAPADMTLAAAVLNETAIGGLDVEY